MSPRAPASSDATRRQPQLDPRHLRALAAAARGLCNHEIAEQLSCSPRTIEGIVGDAVDRIGAKNRPHLVALAIELGLIDPLPDTDALRSLTARQRVVAEGVAAGETAADLAMRLGITKRTARAHTDAARRSVGSPTSTGLAALVASRKAVALRDRLEEPRPTSDVLPNPELHELRRPESDARVRSIPRPGLAEPDAPVRSLPRPGLAEPDAPVRSLPRTRLAEPDPSLRSIPRLRSPNSYEPEFALLGTVAVRVARDAPPVQLGEQIKLLLGRLLLEPGAPGDHGRDRCSAVGRGGPRQPSQRRAARRACGARRPR